MIHFSRNPLMARVLTEMKYMRELGEGVDRMILEMEQMGLVPPVFEEFAFMVRVVLRNNLEERRLESEDSIKLRHDLKGVAEREHRLLAFLNEHESINWIEYEKMFNISRITAKSDLQYFIKKNLIKKVGNGRKVRYKVK